MTAPKTKRNIGETKTISFLYSLNKNSFYPWTLKGKKPLCELTLEHNSSQSVHHPYGLPSLNDTDTWRNTQSAYFVTTLMTWFRLDHVVLSLVPTLFCLTTDAAPQRYNQQYFILFLQISYCPTIYIYIDIYTHTRARAHTQDRN